jgi:hypothetical protein
MSSAWISFLKFMAWVNFIVSFIAALVIMSSYGQVERVKTDTLFGVTATTEKITNMPIIGLGIGLILESFIVLAFLMVICYIAENVSKYK